MTAMCFRQTLLARDPYGKVGIDDRVQTAESDYFTSRDVADEGLRCPTDFQNHASTPSRCRTLRARYRGNYLHRCAHEPYKGQARCNWWREHQDGARLFTGSSAHL